MNQLKYILIVALVMVSSIGFAQKKLILSSGVSYQKQLFGEFSIMLSETAMNHMGLGIYGPKLGVEMNFKPNDFIYAPKLGFEVSVLFFSVQSSIVGYIENGNTDLRLLPEIGFSFFGLANLTYGYGIPILNYKVEDVSRHRVALTFNLSRDLWKDIFK